MIWNNFPIGWWNFSYSAHAQKSSRQFRQFKTQTLKHFEHSHTYFCPPPFCNVVVASETVKCHLNIAQGKGVFQGFLTRIVGSLFKGNGELFFFTAPLRGRRLYGINTKSALNCGFICISKRLALSIKDWSNPSSNNSDISLSSVFLFLTFFSLSFWRGDSCSTLSCFMLRVFTLPPICVSLSSTEGTLVECISSNRNSYFKNKMFNVMKSSTITSHSEWTVTNRLRLSAWLPLNEYFWYVVYMHPF